MSKTFRFAWIKSIPIMCSYLFLSMAFGIAAKEAGVSAFFAFGISAFIYTGVFQFVLISFIAANTPVLTIAMTALLMNSRHMFYGLQFVEKFKSMGRKYLYMIFSLTDETYSVNCSLGKIPEDIDEKQVLYDIAWLARVYWLLGTLAGLFLGTMIPFDFAGIDFCLTALFVTIVIDQWKQFKSHVPVLTGLITGIAFLLLLGPDAFILPTLVTALAVLILLRGTVERKEGS